LSSVEGAGKNGHTRVDPKREGSKASGEVTCDLTPDEHG